MSGGVARPLPGTRARPRAELLARRQADRVCQRPRAARTGVRDARRRRNPPADHPSHSGVIAVEGWFPDGQSLLVSANRDHNWRDTGRFFRIALEQRGAEELLFDSYGRRRRPRRPTARTLLFTREGVPWWRKGYHGSRAAQIWQFDRKEKTFTKLLEPGHGRSLARSGGPMVRASITSACTTGSFNLREHDLIRARTTPLTEFNDDSRGLSRVSPATAPTIVFRHLFDFYRFHPARGAHPERSRSPTTATARDRETSIVAC